VVKLPASVYGLSAFGLSQQLGIEPGEAKQFIAAYFEKYSGVPGRSSIGRSKKRDGDMKVRERFLGGCGRFRTSTARTPTQRGFAERTAVNTPLQGTAADLIKIAIDPPSMPCCASVG